MKTIQALIEDIERPDHHAYQAALARWNSVAKPLGSLGCLEEMICRIAALRGWDSFELNKRALLVFCADNGVVARGVSQCGSEVTGKVAIALAEGRSTANTMAHAAHCRVIPVDFGIRDFAGHPGVRNLRVRNGTGDIARENAMTGEECVSAILRGAGLVEELTGEGLELLAVGEMGIGNTTTGAALSAALLGLDADTVTGRGAGLDLEGMARKREAIRLALKRNQELILQNRQAAGQEEENCERIIALLAGLGGLDIAGMCGAFLGAAACRIPVIIDGMISAVAALCAASMCPRAKTAMLASHLSAEPAGRLIMERLALDVPIHAGMRLGEGTGALMLMPMLEMAWDVYNGGQSFDALGIEAYQPL